MNIDKDLLYRKLGTKIKHLREEKSLTQEQLALSCGVLRTSISNIESGNQRIPVSLLYSISGALDTAVTTLLPDYKEISDPYLINLHIPGEIDIKNIPKTEKVLRDLKSN